MKRINHKVIGTKKIRIDFNNSDERKDLLIRCCELLLVNKLDCLHELQATLGNITMEHLMRFFSEYQIPCDIRHEDGVMKLLIICPELQGDADFFVKNHGLIRNNPEVDGDNSTDFDEVINKTLREKSMEQESNTDLFS